MTKTTMVKRVADADRGVWRWEEEIRDRRWLSASIPDGDACVARVERSFSKSSVTGEWSYYAYRSGKILGVRPTAEEAKKLCRGGKPDNQKDQVHHYVTNHSGDIPAFLLLTEPEQRAVRAQYPASAPARGATERAQAQLTRGRGDNTKFPYAADLSDPSTVKFLETMRAQLAEKGITSDSPGSAQKRRGDTAPPVRASAAPVAGRLVRSKDGNPKKPGTGAHKRWEKLFAACEGGGTVERYAADGGNMETLANAISRGYVKVEAGK